MIQVLQQMMNDFTAERRKSVSSERLKRYSFIQFHSEVLGVSEITANLYCNCVHLYWEGCAIISKYIYAYIYTECFIYCCKCILQITQPSQYRCTQLQYRFAVISAAPSDIFCCEFALAGILSVPEITTNLLKYRFRLLKQMQYRFAVNFGTRSTSKGVFFKFSLL